MYQDYKDLLSAFHAHGVKYLIVGGSDSSGRVRRPDQLLSLGSDPRGFDILTDLPGVDFDGAWERRVEGVIDAPSGLTAFFISRDDLIAAKLAADRPSGPELSTLVGTGTFYFGAT